MLHEIPMPGDAVRLQGQYLWVNDGAMGVINGSIGEAQDRYAMTFNSCAYRQHIDHGCVSASGGPVPRIGTAELTPTGETVPMCFWRFRGGDVRAHNGENYTLDVPLWIWVPRQHRILVDEALSTARYWEGEGAPDIIDAVKARAFLAAL